MREIGDGKTKSLAVGECQLLASVLNTCDFFQHQYWKRSQHLRRNCKRRKQPRNTHTQRQKNKHPLTHTSHSPNTRQKAQEAQANLSAFWTPCAWSTRLLWNHKVDSHEVDCRTMPKPVHFPVNSHLQPLYLQRRRHYSPHLRHNNTAQCFFPELRDVSHVSYSSLRDNVKVFLGNFFQVVSCIL